MEKKQRSTLVRLIVCLAVLAIIIPVGYLTKLFNAATDWNNIKVDFASFLKLICMIAGVLAAEVIISFLLGLPKPESHRARSVLSIISSLLKYVAGIVIICWGLSIIGVNVSTIFASVGVLALIVGFSAESLIADVVTGAFMLFENQYNVGDIVEVDNFRGVVTSIGIRTTCITDAGDNIKIVNNSSMKNILNRSDNVSRCISDISIPYATDLEALEAKIPGLMQEIYQNRTDLMKNPPRYLGLQSLADSALVLRFVADVAEKDIFTGARVLNHDLFLGFRKLGVEVPFPQMDVHMDSEKK